MNVRDLKRIENMRAQANKLMNGPPSLNPVVSTADVVEALIGDLGQLLADKNPKYLAELIERDSACPDHPHTKMPDCRQCNKGSNA